MAHSRYFSSLLTILSLLMAFIAHCGLFIGFIVFHHQSVKQSAKPKESANIIYADLIQQSSDHTNKGLQPEKEKKPPLSKKHAQKHAQESSHIQTSTQNKIKQAPPTSKPTTIQSANKILLPADSSDILIDHFLQDQEIGLKAASYQPQLHIKKDKTQKVTPKKIPKKTSAATSSKKSIKTKGTGQETQQVNHGKVQSARCNISRIKSSIKPKKPTIIHIVVSPSGRKKKISIIRSSGSTRYDKIAQSAAKKARCRPYIQNGTAKEAIVQITFR